MAISQYKARHDLLDQVRLKYETNAVLQAKIEAAEKAKIVAKQKNDLTQKSLSQRGA